MVLEHGGQKAEGQGRVAKNIAVPEIFHLLVSLVLIENEKPGFENVQEKYCAPKKRETFERHNFHHMHLSKNRISFISSNLRNL